DVRFEFALYDSNGNVISTAHNVNGSVTFAPITFTQVGTYEFTMRELSQSGEGWTTDPTVYPITVVVTEDSQNKLAANAEYPQGQPSFVNSYTVEPPPPPEPASAVISARKRLEGASLQSGMFRFALFDQYGTEVTSATNDASGNVTFPTLIFDRTGVYTYTIRETTQSGDEWVTDGSAYSVTVTVTLGADGNLTADVVYQTGEAPTFVNRPQVVPPKPPIPPEPPIPPCVCVPPCKPCNPCTCKPPSAPCTCKPPSTPCSCKPPSAPCTCKPPSAPCSCKPPSTPCTCKPPSAPCTCKPPSTPCTCKPPSAPCSCKPPSAPCTCKQKPHYVPVYFVRCRRNP
ncbi:MAG: hypothetical protein LBC65_05750, partial [Oscillospiraceae bacterium]|nr:hypothetical protein [Oscillospiraceae bacterium]